MERKINSFNSDNKMIDMPIPKDSPIVIDPDNENIQHDSNILEIQEGMDFCSQSFRESTGQLIEEQRDKEEIEEPREYEWIQSSNAEEFELMMNFCYLEQFLDNHNDLDSDELIRLDLAAFLNYNLQNSAHNSHPSSSSSSSIFEDAEHELDDLILPFTLTDQCSTTLHLLDYSLLENTDLPEQIKKKTCKQIQNSQTTGIESSQDDVSSHKNFQGNTKKYQTNLALLAQDQFIRLSKYGDIALTQNIARKNPKNDAFYDQEDSFIDDDQVDTELKQLAICSADYDDFFMVEGGLRELVKSSAFKDRLKDIQEYRDTKKLEDHLNTEKKPVKSRSQYKVEEMEDENNVHKDEKSIGFLLFEEGDDEDERKKQKKVHPKKRSSKSIFMENNLLLKQPQELEPFNQFILKGNTSNTVPSSKQKIQEKNKQRNSKQPGKVTNVQENPRNPVNNENGRKSDPLNNKPKKNNLLDSQIPLISNKSDANMRSQGRKTGQANVNKQEGSHHNESKHYPLPKVTKKREERDCVEIKAACMTPIDRKQEIQPEDRKNIEILGKDIVPAKVKTNETHLIKKKGRKMENNTDVIRIDSDKLISQSSELSHTKISEMHKRPSILIRFGSSNKLENPNCKEGELISNGIEQIKGIKKIQENKQNRKNIKNDFDGLFEDPFAIATVKTTKKEQQARAQSQDLQVHSTSLNMKTHPIIEQQLKQIELAKELENPKQTKEVELTKQVEQTKNVKQNSLEKRKRNQKSSALTNQMEELPVDKKSLLVKSQRLRGSVDNNINPSTQKDIDICNTHSVLEIPDQKQQQSLLNSHKVFLDEQPLECQSEVPKVKQKNAKKIINPKSIQQPEIVDVEKVQIIPIINESAVDQQVMNKTDIDKPIKVDNKGDSNQRIVRLSSVTSSVYPASSEISDANSHVQSRLGQKNIVKIGKRKREHDIPEEVATLSKKVDKRIKS